MLCMRVSCRQVSCNRSLRLWNWSRILNDGMNSYEKTGEPRANSTCTLVCMKMSRDGLGVRKWAVGEPVFTLVDLDRRPSRTYTCPFIFVYVSVCVCVLCVEGRGVCTSAFESAVEGRFWFAGSLVSLVEVLFRAQDTHKLREEYKWNITQKYAFFNTCN